MPNKKPTKKLPTKPPKSRREGPPLSEAAVLELYYRMMNYYAGSLKIGEERLKAAKAREAKMEGARDDALRSVARLEKRVAFLEGRLVERTGSTAPPAAPPAASPGSRFRKYPEFGGAELSVRGHNVLLANGVSSAEQLLALDLGVARLWKNSGPRLVLEYSDAQDALRRARGDAM